MKSTGFGIMELGFHATAIYADPQTGDLYLVLDQNDEPDDTTLPERANPPAYVNGTTIFKFEGSNALMNYRWRSKKWFLESPTTFGWCRVIADDYTNLLVRFYADGAQFYEVAVTSQLVFPLPRVDEYRMFEVEILGTSTVNSIEAVEDVGELQH
jgi:hypothetical protein